MFFYFGFNQIIVLNCCGLQYNTKKNIEIREQIDSILAQRSSILALNNIYTTTNSDYNDENDDKNIEIELTSKV